MTQTAKTIDYAHAHARAREATAALTAALAAVQPESEAARVIAQAIKASQRAEHVAGSTTYICA